MKSASFLLPALPLMILAAAPAVVAGPDSSPVDPPPITAPPPEGGWWFRVAPYAWVTAVEGDVSIGPLSAPVDITMSDTLEDVDMAYMGVIEAGYGRWSLGLDAVYAKTSDDIAGGGRIFDSFRWELKEWLVTPFVGFRLIETDNYRMDVFAGGRWTILDTELTGRFVRGGEQTAQRDTDWIDPIIGIRGQAELGGGWFFRYNGDIGGFGTSSEFIWQAFAGFGYHFNETCSLGFGYRGLGIDYDKGSFSMDTVTHGPVIGFEFRF
jgi:hypothetical protein